jgi:hypothetical protein
MSCLRATPWRLAPSHDPGSTVITEYGSRVVAVCQDLSTSIRPHRRGADPVLTHVACTTTSTTAFQHGAFASGMSRESSAHVARGLHAVAHAIAGAVGRARRLDDCRFAECLLFCPSGTGAEVSHA